MPRARVLIVDDNRDSADALAVLLELLDCEVRCAYDGRSALALLDEFTPGLMLLDLSMPGMDGFALAQQIRARPQLADVPMVAVSGFGAPADRERSLAAGFDRHLLKPVEFACLEELLPPA